jgi:two-component system response regulator QseB/two-component system response regulator TctD
LYIIDLGLPDDDGIGLITRLRQKHDHRPILVITARVALEDRISGLDLGADDYLAKPFNNDELLARIRALLRRPPTIAPALKQVGKLSFDLQNQTIQCDGRELNLSPSEHRLLALFLRRTERIVTPGDIEQISNDLGREVSENAVQQAISRLRKLLARIDPALSIRTIRGSGYMLTLGQP